MTSHKKALMSAITGLRYGAPASESAAVDVVMVEQGTPRDILADLSFLSASTTVFVPEGLGRAVPAESSAIVVEYTGNLGAPGDELALGEDFYVQTLAYSVLEFVDLPGPTAVFTASEEDLEAYRYDAHVAVETGVFAPHLVNPEVQMFDLGALGYPVPTADPFRRVYVDRLGECRVSPNGRSIGKASDPVEHILADTVAAQIEIDENSVLPSFGPVLTSRYCVVADSLKYIAARGSAGLSVSGFGGRLMGDRPVAETDHDVTHPLSPVLVTDGESRYFVHLPAVSRTFEVDTTVASAVEQRYSTAEPSPTLDAVATRLGLDWTTSWQ